MDYLLNAMNAMCLEECLLVLNLIINGLPSKLKQCNKDTMCRSWVLNLIINGLPSKPTLGSTFNISSITFLF